MVTLKGLNFYYLDHPFHSRNLISIFVSELCDMRHHSHQQRQIIVSLDNTWLQQNVKIMTLYIYDDNEYQQKSEYVLIKETVQQEATFVKDFYLQILDTQIYISKDKDTILFSVQSKSIETSFPFYIYPCKKFIHCEG